MNAMNIFKKIALSVGAAFSILAPAVVPALAADGDPNTFLRQVADNSGYETTGSGTDTLLGTIGNLIRVVLGFLGVICLLLVLWAGWLWMTAGGDDKKVGQAKTIMYNAVIGLVIILSAYAISSFIFEQLTNVTNYNGNGLN